MDLLCGKRGLDVAQGGMVFQDNLAVDDFASRTQGHGSQLPTRQIPRSHNSEGFRWYYAPKRESGIMTRSLDHLTGLRLNRHSVTHLGIAIVPRKVEFLVQRGKRSRPTTLSAVFGVRTKATVTITSISFVLSLITWYLFYKVRMPLGISDTSIVAGFWLLVVTLSQWLFNRLVAQKKRRTHK